MGDDLPVMFYNGADAGTRWRIGWLVFAETYSRVIERCSEPLVVPPPHRESESDIAFVASAVEDGDTIALYYHVADQYPPDARPAHHS